MLDVAAVDSYDTSISLYLDTGNGKLRNCNSHGSVSRQAKDPWMTLTGQVTHSSGRISYASGKLPYKL
jgi:hypothetical protein